MIKDLIVRHKAVNLLDKTEEKLHDIILGNDFVDMTAKPQTTKNEQVGLHKTKMLVHSKVNNHQSEKQPKNVRKYLRTIHLKRSKSPNYKKAHTTR